MSLLVVGLSHHTAGMDLMDRVALDADGTDRLAALAASEPDVGEVVALSTCNRTELYLSAHTFHGALAGAGQALAAATGVPLAELTPHLHVHYQDRAAGHLFAVTGGLDSMAVGEPEILGQVRTAYAVAQRAGRVGAELHPLFQRALRLGKQVRSRTAIGSLAPSLVDQALAAVAAELPGDLADARVVLVGAGAMSGLAAATLARRGVHDLVVVNRTSLRARRLAGEHGGRAVAWAELDTTLPDADLVLCCTGSPERVIGTDTVRTALAARTAVGRGPLVLVDLAVPRDVDPVVAELAGVVLWSLADAYESAPGPDRTDPDRTDPDRTGPERTGPEVSGSGPAGPDGPRALAQAREMVDLEVLEHMSARRAHEVGPTVAALRARAEEVVQLELARLDQRAPDLSAEQRHEVERTLARVLDKLLHTPTVRLKELPHGTGAGDYAHALRDLFDLDPRDVSAVSTPPANGPER